MPRGTQQIGRLFVQPLQVQRLMRVGPLLVPHRVDPHQGQEVSSRRHAALQLHQVLMRGVQELVPWLRGGEHSRGLEVHKGDDRRGQAHRQLPDPVERLREGKEHHGDPKHSVVGYQNRKRTRMRDPHHRHLGVPQACGDKECEELVLHIR